MIDIDDLPIAPEDVRNYVLDEGGNLPPEEDERLFAEQLAREAAEAEQGRFHPGLPEHLR